MEGCASDSGPGRRRRHTSEERRAPGAKPTHRPNRPAIGCDGAAQVNVAPPLHVRRAPHRQEDGLLVALDDSGAQQWPRHKRKADGHTQLAHRARTVGIAAALVRSGPGSAGQGQRQRQSQ